MTFYEAAVEVLRDEGRPLHFKKITAHAIKRNLLSHVGRTPEATMEERLTQETKKADDDGLIKIVRPGVFTLRDGADLEEARQTVRLRGPNADDESAVQDAKAAAKQLVDTQNERPKLDAETAPASKPSEPAKQRTQQSSKPSEPAKQKAPQRKPAADVKPLSSDELGSVDVGSRAAVGDIAEQLAALLDSSGSLSLLDLARSLEGTAWSAIRDFGPAVLRGVLLRANRERGVNGQPPLFAEAGDNHWTLAAATDAELAGSYDALDEWQAQHRHLLLDRLTRRLSRMSHGKFAVIVGLIMERLGYSSIEEGKVVGNEVTNLVGTLDKGFFQERVVIRLLKRGRKGNAEDVISFRGSLNLYRADRGILISLDGFADDAEEHKRVDNMAAISLIGRADLADLMLQTDVGVRRYHVETACLDDAFLAD